MKTTNYHTASTGPTVPSRNTFLLLITIVSISSAFNREAATASTARLSVFDAHTTRPSLRRYSTGMYRSRVRSSSSTASLLRKTQDHGLMRTRLQFCDNASSKTTIESGWWRKLFTTSTVTSSSPDRPIMSESEEQDNVDAYLEFLDKRYRRLHCDDTKDDKSSSQQRLGSKKSKSFSAIDWLTAGGNDNTNAVTTSQEQQEEDALYVLGVAGLASQKLLQKHHLPNPNKPASQSTKISSDGMSTDAVGINREKFFELDDHNDAKSTKIKSSEMLVKVILLPIVRIIYLAQRQKHLFLKIVHQNLAEVATKLKNTITTKFSRGPKSIGNALLTICGGRQNILRTVAIGYATIVFLRPLLRAILAEGLAFDPLLT